MKKVGTSSWVGKLRTERGGPAADPRGAAKPGAAKGAKAPGAPADVPPSAAPDAALAARGLDQAQQLALARVPEKLAKEHGPALAAALPDALELARFVGGLEPWRTRAVERIVDQTYKALGLALSQSPAEARAELAASTLAAYRALAEAIGPSDQLGPALNAALGLFELGLRHTAQKRLESKPAERTTAMASAKDAVLALHARLADRAGAGTALNVFPVLVEQLERAEPKLTPAARQKIWAAVSGFLVETGPKTGFTQEAGAELTKAVGEALAAKPADTAAALADARARFLQLFELPRKEIEDQLAAPPPPNLAPDAAEAHGALHGALVKVAAAHPAASDALRAAIVGLQNAATAELGVARPAQLGAGNYWPVVTALIERLGTSELAAPGLEWITRTLPLLRQRPAAGQALAQLAGVDDAGPLARGLATAACHAAGWAPAQAPGLDAELDRLAQLPASRALQAALAASAGLQGANVQWAAPLVQHVVDEAAKGGRDDLAKVLSGLAKRDATFLEAFGRYGLGARDATKRTELARAISLASTAAGDVANAANPVAQLARSLENSLPQARLQELAADAGGGTGLWALGSPDVRHRHPAQQILDQLLVAPQRAGTANQPADVQSEVAKLVVRLALVVSDLDGEYQLPLERIRTDLEAALRNPAALKLPAGDQASLRAFQAKPSVSALVAALPQLPVELACTAGVHLSPEQQTWLGERMERSAGRDTKRALRDFVFACVANGRLDLLDATRASQAPSKAISRLVSFVAKSYREGRIQEVQWDALVQGLRANEDPVAAIERAKIEATLKQLNLGDLAGAKLDPAGLEEIAKSGEAITYLFQNFRPGYVYDGIDHSPLQGVLTDVLRSVASGTWPRSRYESEAGKATMALLSPEQQAIWRSELVTPMNAAGGDAAEQEELNEAMTLLRGLAAGLPREAKLQVPGLGALAYDAASLAKVEAHYAEQIARIRDVPKGTPEHKQLSGALGATREAVALLRLHQAVTGKNADPKALLLQVRGLLGDAASVLRRHGLQGSAEAATRVSFVARDLKTSPKQGSYACDEDGLHSLLTTCTGGCIHYTNVRRWALSSLAANANERILRVYEGQTFVGRAILKFFNAKIDGYEGPVLWINQYNRNGGGGTQAHQDLLAKHALLKAKAMGIPVLSSYTDMKNAAAAMGRQVEQKQVTLQIPDGVTGLQFMDYLLRDARGGYAYETKKLRGDKPLFESAPMAVNVVMPG